MYLCHCVLISNLIATKGTLFNRLVFNGGMFLGMLLAFSLIFFIVGLYEDVEGTLYKI